MSMKSLRLFGIITVAIEWIGIVLGAYYTQNFNPDIPISVATTSARPLPLIFGVVLSCVGITYFVFSLSLKNSNRAIPYIAAIAGLAFMLTGWIPYTGLGGHLDTLHNTAVDVAILGYAGMVLLMTKHPHKRIKQSSMAILSALLVACIFSFVSLYVIHKFTAIAQLVILVLLQIWTIIIFWHESKLSIEQENLPK